MIETAPFIRDNPLTQQETNDLISFLAVYPTAGDLIPGSGGYRKLRWAAKGKGKSGGARVVTYFHSANYPLFLITAYSKSDKEDMTQAERNTLKALAKTLLGSY